MCRCGWSPARTQLLRVPTVPAPVLRVSGSGLEIDAVKLADDGSGDLVVRLHEAAGTAVR